MDYDLSFVTSNGNDISNVLSEIESIKDNLNSVTDVLNSNWSGSSNSNYVNAETKMVNKFNEESEQLAEIINLLGLIQQHNALRTERAQKLAEIESLKPRLYTTYRDSQGHKHTKLNHDIKNRIDALQERIDEINIQMDRLVRSISSITGG